MATKKKIIDIFGKNGDVETHMCIGKAIAGELKEYASAPSRCGGAHVWRTYYIRRRTNQWPLKGVERKTNYRPHHGR